MNIATIIHTHSNSDVFKDTLSSVFNYINENVLVLVDGYACEEFKDAEYRTLFGFKHGLPSAPFRNVCLGLMYAWKEWGQKVDWYCYLEYDCLVASSDFLNHLKKADELGMWIVGNDHRTYKEKIDILDLFVKNKEIDLNYLLGCCVFYNSIFLKRLWEDNFFEKFLNLTNEYPKNITFSTGKKSLVYDLSEFLYPTLAVNYGGKVEQFACWKNESHWEGNYQFYPMRFRPDLTLEDPYQNACILHPLKEFDNPIRAYHRQFR